MPTRRTVKNAKPKSPDVLPRARTSVALGAWLVDTAPKGAPLVPASRKSKRDDPFAPVKSAARLKAAPPPGRAKG